MLQEPLEFYRLNSYLLATRVRLLTFTKLVYPTETRCLFCRLVSAWIQSVLRMTTSGWTFIGQMSLSRPLTNFHWRLYQLSPSISTVNNISFYTELTLVFDHTNNPSPSFLFIIHSSPIHVDNHEKLLLCQPGSLERSLVSMNLTDTCTFRMQLKKRLFILAYTTYLSFWNCVEAPLATLGAHIACEMAIM